MDIPKPKEYVIRIDRNGSVIYNEHNHIECNLIAVVLNHNYDKIQSMEDLQYLLNRYLNFEVTVEKYDIKSTGEIKGAISCRPNLMFVPIQSSIVIDFIIRQ